MINSHECNLNTKKLASSLSNIKSIMCNVAAHLYCSLMDEKDTYEQIRVIFKHVPHTLFTTPDRTIVSNMLQIDNCNDGATY